MWKIINHSCCTGDFCDPADLIVYLLCTLAECCADTVFIYQSVREIESEKLLVKL